MIDFKEIESKKRDVMEAIILNIGDELLIGQVVNTNASWMANELEAHAIHVKRVMVVSDDVSDITDGLQHAMQSADVVLITGGLGPTKDDITKQVLCNVFASELVTDKDSLEHVSHYFESRGMPMSEVNRAQALVPACCKVLHNKVGTAPGMWFEEGACIVVSLPGVPFEMKWLMQHAVLPALNARQGSEAIWHKTIMTCGIGESFLADKIAAWEDALPEQFKLAYLPKAGEVRLRLSSRGEDLESLQKETEKQIEELKPLIEDYLYGFDEETLSEVIGKLLRAKGMTLSTAESCTGGTVSHRITEVAGASDYFVGGVVSYSNAIKQQCLGVREETLEHYGAVSQETVIEMAEGCRNYFKTDYAIATTGIAGPGGGTEAKPVGTVWIAVSTPQGTFFECYCFPTLRAQHQERTSVQALYNLWRQLR